MRAKGRGWLTYLVARTTPLFAGVRAALEGPSDMSILRSRPLNAAGRRRLLSALKNRLLAVCFGAGVDSTAMLIALRLAGIRPHVITFADVAAEKPGTMVHLDRIAAILAD